MFDRLFRMRGTDHQQADMCSYISREVRVRTDHPLRAIRAMADTALKGMSERFDSMCAEIGRPSIPPEKLLLAQLIQMLYSVRSERLLMEEIDYSVLFPTPTGTTSAREQEVLRRSGSSD
jgi:transposase